MRMTDPRLRVLALSAGGKLESFVRESTFDGKNHGEGE